MRNWARGLVQDLNGTFGRLLGAGMAIEFFRKVEQYASNIHRAMQLTGQSAYFIQGAFEKAEMNGVDPEKLIRPLAQLTGLTSNSGRFLEDLAEKYVKLNTQEERNAMLMGIGIKNWQALIPLLEQGREGIKEMNNPGAFKRNFMMSDQDIMNIHMFTGGLSIIGSYAKGLTGMLAGFALMPVVNIANDIAARIFTIKALMNGKNGNYDDELNAFGKPKA
jgi:hypothetical protein